MHEEITQEVLTTLGLNAKHMFRGDPYFVGWWQPINPPIGSVGRLVEWLPEEAGKPRRCAYVELPSFNSGIAVNGQAIEPGSERLTEVCSIEDMRRMMVAGLAKLKEIVASEGATNPA